MGAFRFLHRWTALVQPDDELADAVPLLEDRDRELEDYLLGGTKTATPTLDQGGSVAVEASSFVRYTQQGAWIVGCATVAADAAGTAGNPIQVGGLPAARESVAAGPFGYFDSGVAWRVGTAFVSTGGVLTFYVNAATDQLGIDPNFAVAAADSLYVQFAYEIG